MSGMARKKRIRAIGEGGSSTRVSKAGSQASCSNCKKPGHNKATCKNPVVKQTPKPKGVLGSPRKKQSVGDVKDVDVVVRGPVRDEGAGGSKRGASGSRGGASGSRGGASVSRGGASVYRRGVGGSRVSAGGFRGGADADHAGCQDTRRSTSGSVQFLGDKLVSCSSKKQKVNGWTWIFRNNNNHNSKPIDNPHHRDLEKVATSFYVSNLPDSLDAKGLWNACVKYGRLVDSFIVNKRSEGAEESTVMSSGRVCISTRSHYLISEKVHVEVHGELFDVHVHELELKEDEVYEDGLNVNFQDQIQVPLKEEIHVPTFSNSETSDPSRPPGFEHMKQSPSYTSDDV
ncbi:hypothetical protein Tco_0516956 [Tanacetum coccineum]